MKKLLFITTLILGSLSIAYAATPPTINSLLSWNGTIFTSTTSPTVGYITATSSFASQLPYASSTALSASTFCLLTNCISVWPTGSGGGSGNVGTSSVPVIGNLAYWTTTTATPALLGTVGTSTLTPTSPLGGSFVQIGTGGSITCSTCLTTATPIGSLFSTTSTNYWLTSTSSPLTVSSILATSTATSTFTGPVVIGSGTTGTSTMTIGVAGLKEGCINFVTFNGTTWATSSMYMEGSSVISEANACR